MAAVCHGAPMRWCVALVGLLVGCGAETGLLPAAARRDGLTRVTGFGSNPGQLSLFVHEPPQLSRRPGLVVALHGCLQSAEAYDAAGWDAVADERGFVVAYPQTDANQRCFDWFDAAQQRRDGPEVTSVLQMVEHLVTTHGLARDRVFVTGLSAGGAMTHLLLAVAPDVFSAGAVFAGVPFGCASNQASGSLCAFAPSGKTPQQWGALVREVAGSAAPPRVSLWHGTADTTVAFANLTEAVEQWTDVNGLDPVADATEVTGGLTHASHRDANGVTRVESWVVSGMGHGTPVDPPACGAAAAFMLDVGVCSSRRAADFFGLALDAPEPDGGMTAQTDAGVDEAPRAGCVTSPQVLAALALLLAARRRSMHQREDPRP